MVSHYPAKFGGHSYYGGRDMIFSLVEGELVVFVSK